MKTLTVKVPEALDARLNALARRQSVGRSMIVRRALVRYLASVEGRSSEATFLNLARDLAGSVEGPRDLSTAQRHMKGYGR